MSSRQLLNFVRPWSHVRPNWQTSLHRLLHESFISIEYLSMSHYVFILCTNIDYICVVYIYILDARLCMRLYIMRMCLVLYVDVCHCMLWYSLQFLSRSARASRAAKWLKSQAHSQPDYWLRARPFLTCFSWSVPHAPASRKFMASPCKALRKYLRYRVTRPWNTSMYKLVEHDQPHGHKWIQIGPLWDAYA